MYILLNCTTSCRSGFNWKYKTIGRIPFRVYVFEKSKMAASMVGSNKVARCLYALTLMNMQNIASGDSGSMNLRVITLGHAQSAIVTMTLTYLSRTWTTV